MDLARNAARLSVISNTPRKLEGLSKQLEYLECCDVMGGKMQETPLKDKKKKKLAGGKVKSRT